MLLAEENVETTPAGQAPWHRRRVTRQIAAGVALLAVAGIGLSVSAAAWGQDLREGDRLLPGVTIAGVDVGGATRAEAAMEVEATLADHLDGPVTVTHEVASWTSTPRELGATTDLEEVLATAYAGTVEATLPGFIAARWFGSTSALALEVTVRPDAAAEAAHVATIVTTVDLEPTDATVTWIDDAAQITAHRQGRAVDAEVLATDLRNALADATVDTTTTVAVPVTILPPTVTTTEAETAATAADAAVAAALDRDVEVVDGDRRWTLTPRELDAEVDGAAVVRATLTTPGTPPEVPLTLPEETLSTALAAIASEADVAPVGATARYTGGRVEVTSERVGRAVERTDAAAALTAALTGTAVEVVELPVRAVTPSVTRASFDRVLVVDQGARRLELHRGGQVARTWPVAVGTGGSPTPSGTFVVGAKRFEPTWVNPALDRWGADMPARIGPGPNNPLGLRALNWNRPGGGDTLIRFHGTPNEDSIGEAASNGCVRMFNSDVIELYDLVPSGTMILSVG